MESRQTRLQLGRAANRRHPATAPAPLAVRRPFVRWSARPFCDRDETVAARCAGRKSEHAAAYRYSNASPRLERGPAAGVDLTHCPGVSAARHFDRSSERSWSVRDAAATADDTDLRQVLRVIARPVHPPAERVALLDPIEDEQCPARGVAAERSQSDALAGRVAAAGIRAAEQLHARDILQQLVEFMARRLLDPAGADTLDSIDPLAPGFGKRLAGDDDGRGQWRKRVDHARP